MKIIVCAVSIGEDYNQKSWVKNAIENHRMYCQKNNYNYILRTIPKTDRVANWEKIDLIIDLMKNNKFEIIFWMDIDSVFTNFDIKIESLLDAKNDFYFSGDTNIINSGHFIFRNTDWSKNQLKHIWNIYPAEYGMGGDNASMSVWLGGGNGNMSYRDQKSIYESVDKGYRNKNIQKLVESGLATNYIYPPIRDKVKLLPKKKINSYLYDWTDGDFIFHAVNSSDEKRNALIVSSNPIKIRNEIALIRKKYFNI